MATKYPPPSPKFVRARNQGGRQTPKAIVMHGTVSSDNAGTALNIAQWWNGPGSPMSSCHYVVDPKTVIQCVGDHSIAFHCGYNTGSIGVELCDEQQGPARRWDDDDSRAILARAARLVAELCLAYNIEPIRPTTAQLRAKGPHGIYGHNDSRLAFGRTSHTDPRDFDWTNFLRLVRAEIANIKGEKEPAKAPASTGSRKDRLRPEAYFVGARGSHVKWLAGRLVKHGYGRFYKNGTDNFFSEGEDRAAVAAFQRAQGWSGLGANGLPGPATLKALAARPKKDAPKPPPPAPEPKPEPEPEPAPEPEPPREPQTFKILHAPLHGVSATRNELKRALRRGAVTVGFSEGSHTHGWLRTLPGWRLTAGNPKNLDARGRQVETDVLLLTRRSATQHITSDTVKVADAAAPLKIAPPRYLSYTVDIVDGKPLAVVGMHAHAVVRNSWKTERAEEFRKSMHELELVIRGLREEFGNDLDIVFIGDLNYPNVTDGRYWVPARVFNRLRMKTFVRGVDYLAWSEGLERVDVEVIPREVNGQDHPWIEGTFRRKA